MLLGVRGNEKGTCMPVSLRGSMERVSDPLNLDTSVKEIFGIMLGASVCRQEPTVAMPIAGSVTAVVGFGGMLSGACILRATNLSARNLASRMTGQEFTEVDDTVQDGIGELCNMLAGSWKSKVPELAAHCGLSVPAVITGRDYNLHVQQPEFELRHTYGFDGTYFEVSIVCDGVK